MKIYVATAEPFHDNSTLVGVFATLDAAKAAFPPLDPPNLVEWEDNDNGEWTAQLPARDSARRHWAAEFFQISCVEVGLVLVTKPS